MAGRISDSDREKVRDANRIEAVVSEYVALRNAGGGNLKGLCPFHDERTPSFQVTPARGFYHCFGCGEGGDVFRFLQQIEHLTFVEAVQRLADRSGIALSLVEGGSSTQSDRGSRARLLAANAAAAEFYAERLRTPEAVKARDFLAERGFDAAAATHFGCGYAPDGWDVLTKALLGKGFTAAELAKAGLSRMGQRGPIDQFHRRLTWAIRDAAGDVVGFGARRLFDDDRSPAKYLNTPETPLYRKSQVLFGLDLAKREIARQRRAVVVEGYTDVMAMHLAGVTTAVASCGTAFGEDHIGILRRYLLDSDALRGDVIRGEVVYTFDGDAAGQKAALKAFDSDQKFAANTFIAVAPDGMDPCELRQARGDDAVRALVERREPLISFALTNVLGNYDLDTAEGQVAARQHTVPLVARIREVTLREEYTRKLAGLLGTDIDPLRTQVRQESERFEQQQRRDRDRPAEANPRVRDGRSAYRSVEPAAPADPRDVRDAGERPGDGARSAAEPPVSDEPAVQRPNPRDPRTEPEREVLKLVLQQPDLVADGYEQVEAAAFTARAYALVHEAVVAAGGPSSGRQGSAWLEVVSDRLPSGVLRSLVSELAVEPLRHTVDQADAQYAGAILARMAWRIAVLEVRRLQSELQRAEASGDRERAQELARDLHQMVLYRNALADRASGEA